MTDVHKLSIDNLITDNIDLWTSAIKKRNSQGRGSNSKVELVGIKILRELILDLAVRGKLAPQDPNDEAASVLLDRIESEKAKLISDKIIKKAKGVGASDMPSVNFDCPDGWSLPELSDLILNSADHIVDGPFGSNLKATEYVDSGIPLIRIQNVDRNIFKNNGIQYLTELKASSLSRHSFIAGDIVLNKLGEPTGKACIIPDYLTHGIIVADLIRVRVNEDFHNKNFLIYCINSPLVARQFSGLAKGVTRQRVNLSQVRSIKIPLPPLAEQHRIVAKVDELMVLCDQLEQQTEQSITAHQTLVEVLLATLTDSTNADNFQSNWQRIANHFDVLFTTEASIDQLKQTILQLAVMGKLVPQNPNDEPASKLLEKIAEEKAQLIKDKKIKKQKPLPAITDEEKDNLPIRWSISYMQDITKVVTCGMASTPKYHDKGRIFLSAKNVKPYKFMPQEHKFVDEETYQKITKNSKPEKGDILLTRVGAGIGEAAVVDIDIEFAFYVSLTLVKPFHNHLYSYFLLMWLNSPQGTKKSIDNIYGRGVSAGNLNVNQVRGFTVPIPPLAEQHRIVAKVDELMTLCDQLKTRLADAQTTQLHLADAVVENALN